jgi:hypothetical protein
VVAGRVILVENNDDCEHPNHDSFHTSSTMEGKLEPSHGKVLTRWNVSP